MIDVITDRDALQKRLNLTEEIMSCIARGQAPDVEDACQMPDGTVYTFRVFGVNRAHGGVALISFIALGYGGRETFDAQYFEDAAVQAKHTATAMPDAYAYRDAFERLQTKVKRAQLPACAREMKCLCAGHARGAKTTAECDTRES